MHPNSKYAPGRIPSNYDHVLTFFCILMLFYDLFICCNYACIQPIVMI